MTRNEAIECLRNKKHCKDCKYYEVMTDNTIDLTCWDEAHEMAIEALERKKGEWLFGKQIDGAYDVYGIKAGAILCRCSKCNFAHAFIDGHSSQYHFCPNCGADMR